MCVGETLAENEAGVTEEVIARQVRGGLASVAAAGPLVVAYEPVWAIGTGRPATPAGANRVMGQIRALLGELFGAPAAEGMPILYGGSVTPENFPAFMAEPEIDGGLVGGASLSAPSFVTLARQAAEAGR
jgi:triosephosphate isomerase